MIRTITRLRNPLRHLAALALVTVLAACQVGLPGATGPRVGGGSVEVALLVPYNSAQAGDDLVARSIENAARLAASEISDIAVDITVYPTAGIPEQAASVAEQAVREGADIIVGPLRSDAAAAAGVAARGRVNVLSFSNNSGVAGGNVFVLGTTFDNTANRLVSYAASQGRNQIVVVYAQNLAGEVARDAILRAAPFAGASVVQSVPYEFSGNGVVQALPAVMDAVRSTGANAIFITSDTTGALPLFAQLLPENGLDTEAVRVIGMTRWDTPPQTLELSGLQGGWFALPDPAASSGFEARYASAYGEPPHVLAALGYDAIQLVAQTALQSGQLGAADLVANAGIRGANGVFRLNADGTSTRALAVAEVIDSQVTIRDPAPGSLGGPGL
ncbi:ABC transporter substrate-binding protein [Rhodobacterales bacterium HKCCE3408]|nr:ABC transporter substrate-binding protein [Rhodobacterales bacterium HKCCE3408]